MQQTSTRITLTTVSTALLGTERVNIVNAEDVRDQLHNMERFDKANERGEYAKGGLFAVVAFFVICFAVCIIL